MNSDPFYVWFFYLSVAVSGLCILIGAWLAVSHFICENSEGDGDE